MAAAPRHHHTFRQDSLLKSAFLLLLAGLLCITAWCHISIAGLESDQSQRKYRIGYIEAGPYWGFSETLKQARISLVECGWGDRIEFPPEARFSPGWGAEASALKKVAGELMNRHDVDLIISAGTDATQAMLAANNGRIPIVGIEVSDPLRSGLVANSKDSGIDNFTVSFEEDAYERLFRIFHLSVGFQKLGLLYSTSGNGELYANRPEAHKIARERGFAVVEYNRISAAETEEECLAGLKWLVEQGMDAFYIPSVACFDYSLNPESSQRLLNYLMECKIPTFARDGTIGVRSGALLGLSNLNLSAQGSSLANTIVTILQGTQPRSIPMVISTPLRLSLNLYTADRLGFVPSFDLLTACDVIFRKISIPPRSASE